MKTILIYENLTENGNNKKTMCSVECQTTNNKIVVMALLLYIIPPIYISFNNRNSNNQFYLIRGYYIT